MTLTRLIVGLLAIQLVLAAGQDAGQDETGKGLEKP